MNKERLNLRFIDQLKINAYHYLLSSVHIDQKKRKEMVKYYEYQVYKNRVHEYCSHFKNNENLPKMELYDFCCEKYECGCSHKNDIIIK